MSYKNELRTIARNYSQALREHDKKIAELEAKRKGYYKETFDSEMAKLTTARNQTEQEAHTKLQGVVDAWKKNIHESYIPNGDSLTSDASLLTSGINLSVDELHEMFDKYNGNRTMQRLVSSYAEAKQLNGFARTYYKEEDYAQAIDNLAGYAKNALKASDYAVIMENDAMFNKVTDAILKD